MSSDRPAEVRDVMSRKVIEVNDDDTVEFVINLFDRCHISGAPVLDSEGAYVGVVSRTDLSGRKVLDWVDQDCHLDAMLVREVMSSPDVVTICEDAAVVDAVRLMRDRKIHRIFVTGGNSDRIVGVLSSFDILKVVDTGEAVDEEPVETDIITPPTASSEEVSETQDAVMPCRGEDEVSSPGQKLDELERQIQALIIKKRKSLACEEGDEEADAETPASEQAVDS